MEPNSSLNCDQVIAHLLELKHYNQTIKLSEEQISSLCQITSQIFLNQVNNFNILI